MDKKVWNVKTYLVNLATEFANLFSPFKKWRKDINITPTLRGNEELTMLCQDHWDRNLSGLEHFAWCPCDTVLWGGKWTRLLVIESPVRSSFSPKLKKNRTGPLQTGLLRFFVVTRPVLTSPDQNRFWPVQTRTGSLPVWTSLDWSLRCSEA